MNRGEEEFRWIVVNVRSFNVTTSFSTVAALALQHSRQLMMGYQEVCVYVDRD